MQWHGTVAKIIRSAVMIWSLTKNFKGVYFGNRRDTKAVHVNSGLYMMKTSDKICISKNGWSKIFWGCWEAKFLSLAKKYLLSLAKKQSIRIEQNAKFDVLTIIIWDVVFTKFEIETEIFSLCTHRKSRSTTHWHLPQHSGIFMTV